MNEPSYYGSICLTDRQRFNGARYSCSYSYRENCEIGAGKEVSFESISIYISTETKLSFEFFINFLVTDRLDVVELNPCRRKGDF